MTRQRTRLVLIACVLTLLGFGAIAAWYFFFHVTLRVATGTVGSEGQKFLTAFVRQLAEAYPQVRLKVVSLANLEASAQALEAGTVDMAVVRSDVLTSAHGQTIAILRREVVGLIVPASSSIETVGQLAAKTIGLVSGPISNEHLLDQILTYYQIPLHTVRRVTLAPDEIVQAMRQKRVAAVFAVGPAGPGPLADAVTAVSRAGKGAAELLDIEAAAAIAKRVPMFEEAEIAPGTFGALPPRPAESVTTLSVTTRLVARTAMPNYVAGEVARLLFKTKVALLPTLPQVAMLEAPDTDKGAAFPVHPGAAAYFDGEQTSLFERFESVFYLGMFGISLLGSVCAWLLSLWRGAGPRQDWAQMQQRLLALLREIPAAGPEDLDAIVCEVDEMCARNLEHTIRGTIEAEKSQVFFGAITQVRQAIEHRRALLR
jgi:TRAP transporter TAXI family solute receptor